MDDLGAPLFQETSKCMSNVSLMCVCVCVSVLYASVNVYGIPVFSIAFSKSSAKLKASTYRCMFYLYIYIYLYLCVCASCTYMITHVKYIKEGSQTGLTNQQQAIRGFVSPKCRGNWNHSPNQTMKMLVSWSLHFQTWTIKRMGKQWEWVTHPIMNHPQYSHKWLKDHPWMTGLLALKTLYD